MNHKKDLFIYSAIRASNGILKSTPRSFRDNNGEV